MVTRMVLQNSQYKSESIAIDAMCIMNHILTKTLWIKTEFCKSVDKQSVGAVTAGFEWYFDDSLKSKACQSHQKKGKSKAKQINYNNEPDTDLKERCLKDILGTIAMKKLLTKLLINNAARHLKT